MLSPYYSDTLKQSAEQDHRGIIGGLWEEMGTLQLNFLIEHGLTPHKRLLDIGCGSLRLGRLATEFLEAGNYYGTDISAELIDAGYGKELNDEQRLKLPRSHFGVSENFDFGFLDNKMDVAIAQSVFTHLPMNHIRHCLIKLYPHMSADGIFYASIALCPDHHNITEPLEHPADEALTKPVTSYDTRDPYHYTMEDMEYCAKDTPWKFQFIGDWGHPRNLQMVAFMLDG